MIAAIRTSNALERIFLFHGADDYTTHHKVLAWIEAFGQRHSVFGIVRVDCEETPDEARRVLFAATDTVGLFSSKRLLVLKHFFQQKANVLEDMLRALDRLEPDTFVMFWETTAVNKRLRSYKRLQELAEQKLARIYYFDHPTRVAVERFILERGQRHGVRFAPGAALTLAAAVGFNHDTTAGYFTPTTVNSPLWLVASEIDKLAAYKPGGTVTREDVESLAASTIPENLFEFTEAFGRGDRAAALRCLRSLLSGTGSNQKTRAIMILGALAQQVRSLLAVVSAQAQGASTADVAEMLGWSTFRLKKNQELARRFSKPHLLQLLESIHQLDRRLKSSTLSQHVLLGQLIFERYRQ